MSRAESAEPHSARSSGLPPGSGTRSNLGSEGTPVRRPLADGRDRSGDVGAAQARDRDNEGSDLLRGRLALHHDDQRRRWRLGLANRLGFVRRRFVRCAHRVRFVRCAHRVRFVRCAHRVRFVRCAHRVRFVRCAHRVRFVRCAHRVRFVRCAHRVRFVRCAHRVRFVRCAHRVRFVRCAHSGMFPCFLGGRVSPLGAQQPQRPDDLDARLVRRDHRVDVAALGGDVGVGERVLVLGDQLGPQLPRRRRPRASSLR